MTVHQHPKAYKNIDAIPKYFDKKNKTFDSKTAKTF